MAQRTDVEVPKNPAEQSAAPTRRDRPAAGHSEASFGNPFGIRASAITGWEIHSI